VDVDSEPTDTALPFEKRHVTMCFCVLMRHTEIESVWKQNQSALWNLDVINPVVLSTVEEIVFVQPKSFAEVNVVTV
jgi:hypothetical protein